MPPQTLIMYSSVNSPGKRDASGAFAPGALAFHRRMDQKLLDSTLVGIDCTKAKQLRRHQVAEAFERAGACSMIAIFCHGYERGIQLGFDNDTADSFADLVANSLRGGPQGAPPLLANPRIVLYACDSADGPGPGGDGGFADRLRDELCERGFYHCQVDAHTTTGHSFKNPHVRRFLGMGSPTGGMGGSWIVQPGSKLWPKWRERLREESDTLWMDFPFMAIAQIHSELTPAEEITKRTKLTPPRGTPVG